MKSFIDGIKYGISYFTVLPIKLDKFEADKEFYKGVVYSLPLVGLILSLLTIALFFILPMPIIYKSILCAILYLFLYGFIHLEAVADTIDGYFASLGNKDIHSIMKEPQVGAIGSIGTFCFVLLKVLAIAYLLYCEQYIFIILALVLSRSSILFALDFEYHKESHFINSLKESFDIPKYLKLLLFPLRLLTNYILSKMKKQFGFLNGDILGFNIELQEVLLLNIAILFC